MSVPDDAFPRVVPFGERAYLIELGDTIDPDINARVHALVSELDERADTKSLPGGAVPAYASVLVPFDPARSDSLAIEAELLDLAHEVVAAPSLERGRTVEMPVRYGGEGGPDLDDVAARTGLSVDDVIALHSQPVYRVFMLGFAPGFAYLGVLPAQLRLPRRDEPRIRVPAGSVAIAAAQTAVYPHATAGGWHLLGKTDVELWNGAADPPSLLKPGDHVRFVPA